MNDVLSQHEALADTVRWPTTPYKGLNFYTASDSALFCEREDDIEACARLAAHFATKMLLLHGRTGTGKSSFLRAGLFPHLFLSNSNFFCLVDPASGDPLLIRSTSDPIASITSALRTHLEDEVAFVELPPDVRSNALSQLRDIDGNAPQQRANALRSALELLTAKLPGTFVLAIDQAEEIFTLPAVESTRAAYFEFLETLCFERFDIKLLLALRTEYYGQFADGFRFEPDLKITPVHSGLEQFMLRGIQDPRRLERAILRPTRSDLFCNEVSARDWYKFEYEHGLAAHIAADIVQHCGESSTLPVMQMVCADLYNNIVVKKQLSVIDRRAYKDLGAVEGAIDRFIDSSIQSAVSRATSRDPSQRELEVWKDVLSALVARQEGGALTSLLANEARLVSEAKRQGVAQPIDCLRRMADADLRLLRTVQGDMAGGPALIRYSLGHDALAPSLFQWKEARSQVLEVRESAKKRNRLIWAGAGILAVVSVLFASFNFSFAISAKRASVAAVMRSLDADPDARHRLLYLAALEANTTPIERIFLKMGDVETRLRSTLLSSPVFAYRAVTAGVSRDGRSIAWLDKEGAIRFRTLGGVEAAKVNGTRSVRPPAIPTFPNLVLGFVDGLEEPVIYSDGVLTYWTSNTSEAQTFRPFGATSNPQAFPDFGAGLFRLTVWANESQPKYTFSDFRYDSDNGSFVRIQPDGGISLTVPNRIMPAYSDTTSDFVYASREAGAGGEVDLLLGGRDKATPASPLPMATADRPRQPSAQLYQSSADPLQDSALVPRSVAFLSDHTVVVRDMVSHFAVFAPPSGVAAQPTHYRISSEHWIAAEPVRPQWGAARPVLASVKAESKYRFAWLTEGGIAAFQTDNSGRVVPLGDQSPLLTSLRNADSFSRLKFSADGQYLTLLQPVGRETLIRVWDLSSSFRDSVKSMTPAMMLSAACDVTGRYEVGATTGNTLTKAEFEQLPTLSLLNRQPCSP